MTPTLEVHGIAKSFGDLAAVDDLSFEVRAGEIFGFLGPNGAGKTTTLRMLMGITAPDSGEVLYEGRPRLDRSRVGYLPEERGLFEAAPVIDTLVYLGELRGMKAAAARAAAVSMLERLGLADRAKEKVNVLSKGNQQKVQLLGAILHRPALAVLDEPFSGLDPLNQEAFVAYLRELSAHGMAILLSAHHLDLVERLADRFLLISKGRAVLAGTLDELRRQGAGGNLAVLRLTLSARNGERLDADRVRSELAEVAPGARVESDGEYDGELRLSVLLPEGSDLGPLISRAVSVATVLHVESRRMPLHEIYLRAVREGGGEIREEEVRERA